MLVYNIFSGRRPIQVRQWVGQANSALREGNFALRQLVNDRRFALVDLILVLVSGAVGMLKPEWGFWFFLAALLPAIFRLVGGKPPFQKTQLDGLVVIFFLTAIVGYWAAYDQATAWSKLWFIATGILLYYALSAQPKENFVWVCTILFCIGVGVSIHYILAYDFIGAPRKLQIANIIGQWIVSVRPKFAWTSIHPNYVAGLAAITTPFILFPLMELRKTKSPPILMLALISIGAAIALFAIFMATSRGIWMAILGALGVCLIWRFINLRRINLLLGKEAVFPSIVLIYLCVVVAVLYMGPANSGGIFSTEYFFGTGSRAELFERSLFILNDFPITGGGLGAFPGLYSQYILGIPYFNVPNSHNLFLDVAIEQGYLGGLSFLIIFLASVWFVSHAIAKPASKELQLFNWLVLFALVVAIIHGMVDDYLYNQAGAVLALFLAGISVIVKRESHAETKSIKQWDRQTVILVTLIGVCLTAFLLLNKIYSVWYADLGAVQMAKVELVGFPNTGWADVEIVSQLQPADASLLSSLKSDSKNLTANYRLGLLLMLNRDFRPAATHLETAHRQAPAHRGVTKALGYCYIWLGELDKAQLFLADIPEAKDELDAYVWWWKSQGRADLSEMAYTMIDKMNSTPIQP